MKMWMPSWMPNCKDVSKLVAESMDHDLSWNKKMSMRLHLLMCKYCSRYEKQLLLMRSVIKKQADTEPSAPQKLNEKAKDRLRQIAGQDETTTKDR